MKKINVMFVSFPDYASNAKPLYEYMKKKYGNKMNLSWAVNSFNMFNKLNNMGINVYKIGSEDYIDYVKNVDVFFSTHGNLIGDKNKNSIYFELWHGIGCKNAGYLTNSLNKDEEIWINQLKKKVDYFIVPSEMWSVIFSSMFNIKKDRVLPLGYPKLDEIIYSDGKKNLSNIIGRNVNQYNKVLLYAPTLKKGCNRSVECITDTKDIITIKGYNDKELMDFLKTNNYLLCIKRHPSDELNYRIINENNVITLTNDILQEKNLNINNILSGFDTLITDYSSLMLDFSFLNKNVINIELDLENFEKNRGILLGNFDFWIPDSKVTTLTELLKTIEKPNKLNDFGFKRKMNFNNLNDGGCKSICDYIFNENGQIRENIQHKEDIEDNLNNQILDLKNECIYKEKIINEKDELINKIVNSKRWKMFEKFTKFNILFKKLIRRG